VKINIHEQLWKWRQVIVAEGYVATSKKIGMKGMNFVFSNPKIYRLMGKTGRWAMDLFPFMVNNKLNVWFKQREMPVAPKESFRDWYLKNGKNQK
jgi:L-lactate dehydrogenase complex protein LldF